MTTTLEGFDAGDDVTLNLTVTPAGDVEPDATTSASVTLLDPAGEVRVLTGFPDLARREWTAVLTGVIAGEYVGRWQVTGTGAGVEPLRILVGPGLDVPAGRSYATTGDLVDYLRAAPPADSRLLLARATARVDELLLTAVYDVDDAGVATDADIRAAIVQATCAQAAWFDEIGDDTGSGLADRYSNVKIGNVQISGPAADAHGDPRYAPDAVRTLSLAGLLTGRVWAGR